MTLVVKITSFVRTVKRGVSLTLARGFYEDLSPAHQPPCVGGLAPLPWPQLSAAEHRLMCQLGVVEAMRSDTTLVLEGAVDIQHYAEALAKSGLQLATRWSFWLFLGPKPRVAAGTLATRRRQSRSGGLPCRSGLACVPRRRRHRMVEPVAWGDAAAVHGPGVAGDTRARHVIRQGWVESYRAPPSIHARRALWGTHTCTTAEHSPPNPSVAVKETW